MCNLKMILYIDQDTEYHHLTQHSPSGGFDCLLACFSAAASSRESESYNSTSFTTYKHQTHEVSVQLENGVKHLATKKPNIFVGGDKYQS